MRLRHLFAVILDRRLYGRGMLFWSMPFVSFAFFVQCFILFLFSPKMLIIYIPLFVGFILLSALPAKNFRKEFHTMSYWLICLFLILSILTEAFAFTMHFEPSLIGVFQCLLVLFISNISLLISVLHFVVVGQRVSARESIGLTDNFFTEQKKTWRSRLLNFPNAENIVKLLDEGVFVPSLFDKGLFNLTVLWSCNLMEKIIDTVANEIIKRNPEKKSLFRTSDGRPQNYPRQLKNLGYKHKSDDISKLWNKLRNRIAHHNYKPTFDETYEALGILVSFIKEMPIIIKKWKLT